MSLIRTTVQLELGSVRLPSCV